MPSHHPKERPGSRNAPGFSRAQESTCPPSAGNFTTPRTVTAGTCAAMQTMRWWLCMSRTKRPADSPRWLNSAPSSVRTIRGLSTRRCEHSSGRWCIPESSFSARPIAAPFRPAATDGPDCGMVFVDRIGKGRGGRLKVIWHTKRRRWAIYIARDRSLEFCSCYRSGRCRTRRDQNAAIVPSAGI